MAIFSLNRIQGFQVQRVIFHRNGISGQPFHSVYFTFDFEGSWPQMVAIVPNDSNGNAGIECFVINLNDPTSCWRGDNFARLVWGAIARAEDSPVLQLGMKTDQDG